MTTTFRSDTSFPYLAYAIRHNIPYVEVLRAAEFWYGEISPHLTYRQNVEIAKLNEAEKLRREKIKNSNFPT